MINRNLLVAVCVGMASALTLGILLYDEIENKNLPLLLTSPKMQYAVGEIVVLEVHNTGSYPLLFPNDAFGIRVIDPKGVIIWHAPHDEEHVVIRAKQTQTVTWNTTHFDPGTYTVSSHISIIAASITVTIT